MIAPRIQFCFSDFECRTSPGHASIECKPENAADKGSAVLEILSRWYGPSWQNKVGVIYIGDDTTDEDAMKALKGKAVTMRIFEGTEPKDTAASMTLQSTRSVVHFLHWFSGKLTKSMILPSPTKEVLNCGTKKSSVQQQ